MTNKEAISIIESIRENHIPRKTVYDEALELAIKALEEKVNDPHNDPHYAECDYCKYKDCSSNDYPCCACGSAEEFKSNWERR
jgi:hypothetical protein